MKRIISIILTLTLILTVSLMFTGCDKPTATVTSTMDISSGFQGSRTVTIVYPLSMDIDAVKDEIVRQAPVTDLSGVTFTYKGVEGDGYYFEMEFSFNSITEYESEISAVIGRPADAVLSQKDTALMKGTRMTENFALADIIGWMTRVTSADAATKDCSYQFADNAVTIDSKSFTAGARIDINDCEGSTVNSVSIKTSNDKDGHYDRTFVFSVPNQTYLASKKSLEQYFESNTASDASYYGWSSEGDNMQYTVIYSALSLGSLRKNTSMLLDTDNIEIFYGDKENASTPLSEGLAFEEKLDTFSFVGPDKGAPSLSYSYSLPTSTIHGDGMVFRDGQWVNDGEWKEGVYSVSLNSGSAQVKIPDGIQYTIAGIDFSLESLGSERFRRTTSFLYSKTDGSAGMNYASDFFTAKGFETTTSENDDNLICSVICEGDTTDLTGQLVSLFGSGNFMAYSKSSPALSLSTKTVMTDYINLSSILTSANAATPMHYYIRSSGGDNIVTVFADGSELAYKDPEQSVLTVNNGVATIGYHGSIPIVSHIILYLVIGFALLGITIAVVYFMSRRRTAGISRKAQEIVDSVGADDGVDDSAALSAPAQTTTFSIFELGILSRNKKYVDEINKDIEERMEADRLQERKKELRAKELEEMERKVYGHEEPDSEPEQSDGDEDFLNLVIDEAPVNTVEIPDLPDDEPEEDSAVEEPVIMPYIMPEDEDDDV